MSLFRKPIAAIYVKELRVRLEPLVVPIFTPDSAIAVGDFGSVDDGRFVRRGNVADRGVAIEPKDDGMAPFDFSSAGKVHLGPTVELPNPAGGTLVKGSLHFSKSRAVVTSFKAGVEHTVKDADSFGEQLLRLWYANELPASRNVVWSVRVATGGTVVVSEEGDNTVDVM